MEVASFPAKPAHSTTIFYTKTFDGYQIETVSSTSNISDYPSITSSTPHVFCPFKSRNIEFPHLSWLFHVEAEIMPKRATLLANREVLAIGLCNWTSWRIDRNMPGAYKAGILSHVVVPNSFNPSSHSFRFDIVSHHVEQRQ